MWLLRNGSAIPLQAVQQFDELNGDAFVFWSELLEDSAEEDSCIRAIFAADFGFCFTLRGLRLLGGVDIQIRHRHAKCRSDFLYQFKGGLLLTSFDA